MSSNKIHQLFGDKLFTERGVIGKVYCILCGNVMLLNKEFARHSCNKDSKKMTFTEYVEYANSLPRTECVDNDRLEFVKRFPVCE